MVVGLILGALALPPGAAAKPAVGAHPPKDTWHFVSAPNLHPPRLAVLARTSAAPRRGYFLVDNLPKGEARPLVGEGGPLLLDSALRPVWAHGAGGSSGGDLQAATYMGHRVLMWWSGRLGAAGTVAGIPNLTVVNEHYRTVATLYTTSPWLLDVHDAQILGSDVWVTVWRVITNQDLAPYGGSMNGSLYDYGVQEYDLRTGRLRYTWDPLNPGGRPNVPLSESKQPPPAPGKAGAWDPYHLNSLQVLPNGRLLVSMRNTWSVYLIDRSTGRTVWTLGGRASSFPLERSTRFAWQHDARIVTSGLRARGGPGQELTLFDDNCCALGDFAGRPSRGMIIRVDPTTHRATLVAAYRHSPPLVVSSLGSMQLLPGGNVLIDWGGEYVSEYSKSGQKLLDVQWPGVDRTYRARYTDNWVGTPYYPPVGAVRQVRGRTVVYASWNGATQVARWEVRAGESAGALRRVRGHVRTGFETAIALNQRYRVYEVQAVDGRGRVLRTSAPFGS